MINISIQSDLTPPQPPRTHQEPYMGVILRVCVPPSALPNCLPILLLGPAAEVSHPPCPSPAHLSQWPFWTLGETTPPPCICSLHALLHQWKYQWGEVQWNPLSYQTTCLPSERPPFNLSTCLSLLFALRGRVDSLR